MKAIIYTSFLLVLLFFAGSCKSKKNTGAIDGKPEKSTIVSNQTGSNTTQVNTSTPYRVIVSFISIGEGIDHSIKGEFEKLISSHSPKINYEAIHWGREGEVDYCLNLLELPEKEQSDFVNKIKKLLTTSKLVNILENKPCIHKQ
ncbi:MAG TPA: hypothetical protein VFL70_01010 [Bacteroidia bacterium]|nr:hypothetical protein [Bacteroidia bacterium]